MNGDVQMAKDNWNEAWDAFDRRKGAKAAGEIAANEGRDVAQRALLRMAAE